jgi:hypothetical protein
MIPAPLLVLIETMAADGRVSAEEAARIRAGVFPDAIVSRAEADALFLLNERVAGDDPAWEAAFAEAIADHMIESSALRGHVSDEAATWLQSQMTRDGRIERATELAALLKTIELAESAPPSLAERARVHVRAVIMDRRGVDGADPNRVAGQIGAAEAELVRRVLYACAGAGGAAVSRQEADWLFALDAETLGYAHDPAWQDVFVKAILNHLFAAETSQLLAREPMMRRAAWLAAKTPAEPLAFFGRAFEGGIDRYLRRIFQPGEVHGFEAHYARRNADRDAAAQFDLAEATWLTLRVRHDGRRSPNELALLAAIEAERARCAPAL